MKKVLGIGNALTDILIQVTDNDLTQLNLQKGSMSLVDAQTAAAIQQQFSNLPKSMVAGGSASNTISGIARLGAPAAFVGEVGCDEVGDFYTADTLKNGVKPLLQRNNTLASGNCTVLVTPDGERTMCTYLGAACAMSAHMLKPEMFEGYDIFHIEGYLVQSHDLIASAVRMAKQAGLMVSIDLASYNVVEENLDFLKKIVAESVDIVFANEEEAHAFTGLQPQEALRSIAEKCDIAIVKVGSHGSYIKQANQELQVGVVPAKCIDTTGAGDLYAAGFLYGLASGFPLDRCGKLGALVSGKVVEVIGPKMSDETWREIKAAAV